MSKRGSGSSARAGGGSKYASTPEYKESYNIEMENAHSFEAAFAIESGATKETTG